MHPCDDLGTENRFQKAASGVRGPATITSALKVEVIDRNRNGSDLNAIATGTGFFTV